MSASANDDGRRRGKSPPLASLIVFIIYYLLGVGSLTIVFATRSVFLAGRMNAKEM